MYGDGDTNTMYHNKNVLWYIFFVDYDKNSFLFVWMTLPKKKTEKTHVTHMHNTFAIFWLHKKQTQMLSLDVRQSQQTENNAITYVRIYYGCSSIVISVYELCSYY